MAKAGTPGIKRIEDLDGKEITVLAGSSYLAALVQAHPVLAPTVQGLKGALGEGQDALEGLATLFGLLEATLAPRAPGRPDRL